MKASSIKKGFEVSCVHVTTDYYRDVASFLKHRVNWSTRMFATTDSRNSELSGRTHLVFEQELLVSRDSLAWDRTLSALSPSPGTVNC